MPCTRSILCGLFVVALAVTAAAQDRKAAKAGKAYPPELPGAKGEIYKTVGNAKLNLYIYFPEGHKPTDKRPAIVFFFGGGWTNGSPTQFQHHCEHLASHGMVAITADYRVASRQNVKAISCLADAKSAIRYVRKEAARLGIDPNKIAAGGGSAGGHLAAATAVIREFDESSEDASISSVPNALVLFNPALVLARTAGVEGVNEERVGSLQERMGTDPKAMSPYHHVKAGAPPTIIFHGKADTTVPYATAEMFAKAMTDAGNQCQLVGFEGQAHGFFNYGRNGDEYYNKTVAAMDDFLVAQGFLKEATKSAAKN